MLKRTAFKPKVLVAAPRGRQWEGGDITPRAPAPRAALRDSDLVTPIEKENALQHPAYMAVVRTLSCAHCRRQGPSEFCHSDEGKGKSIKTDCRRGWPGCKDDLVHNRIGCHSLLGSTGTFTKEQRRQLEARYAAETRAQVIGMGKWPKDLPRWKEMK